MLLNLQIRTAAVLTPYAFLASLWGFTAARISCTEAGEDSTPAGAFATSATIATLMQLC